MSKKASKKKLGKKVGKKAKKKVSKKVAKKTTRKVAKKVTRKSNKKTSKKSSAKKDKRFAELQDALDGLNAEKAEALAKNIWLAGLGAYAKTFSEISERVDSMQDRYSAINAEGQKIFQELVKRGDSMQNDLEETVKKGRNTLEDRVEEFKKRFGGSLSSVVDIQGRLKEAAKKVDELTDKLKKK